MPESENYLSITFQNKEPIELITFTNSHYAIADEFNNFLSTHLNILPAKDIKLCIKEIKPGSIETILYGVITPGLIQYVEVVNAIVTYSNYLIILFQYFRGDKEKPEHSINRRTYRNMHQMLDVCAKDDASQTVFSVYQDNRKVNYYILDSFTANGMQNKISREMDLLDQSQTHKYKNKVLRVYQSRDDLESEHGDKGIIESIYTKPIKLAFDNEELKEEILKDPYGFDYVVDVSVETLEGIPRLYNLLKIRDKILRDK